MPHDPSRRALMSGGASLIVASSLSGCVSTLASRPMPAADRFMGLKPLRSLPDTTLPDKGVPVPGTLFVLLPTENSLVAAVDMLVVPIPFVTAAIVGTVNRSAAAEQTSRLSSIDPYAMAVDALTRGGVPKLSDTGLPTRFFVFIQECVDGQYRIASVAQVRYEDWFGRYLVHLPQTFEVAAFNRGSPVVLDQFRAALVDASERLRELLARAVNGQLQPSGVKADIGSLHLTGGRVAGMVSPMIVKARNVDLVEETADEVIVRLSGDPKQSADAGGLQFGVHLLPKAQLHTWVRHG